MHLDAVRIGSAFTGRVQEGVTDKLYRVGYLESRICEVRTLRPGDKVFYSGMFIAKEEMKVGVVEAGYVDGFELSGPKDNFSSKDKLRQMKNVISVANETYITVKGEKCRVLGRIGMKNFIVDLNSVDYVKAGEIVNIDVKLSLCDTGIVREER